MTNEVVIKNYIPDDESLLFDLPEQEAKNGKITGRETTEISIGRPSQPVG